MPPPTISPGVAALARNNAARLCARCRSRASFLLAAGPPHTRRPVTSSAASSPSSPCTQKAPFCSAAAAAVPRPQQPADDTSSSSPPPPPSSSSPQTLYDIFPETLPAGPPPRGHFPIDTRALRREFIKLQARAHPDMHPPGPLKARAEAASARINDAYKTLSNPLLRAQYLLSLRGEDVANDEAATLREGGEAQQGEAGGEGGGDPGLLMLVLEAHEEIAEACGEEDLRPLRELNDERIRRSEEVLERAFREDDVPAAKREAVRLRYWVNIKESLDNWEQGAPVVLEH